MAKCEHKTFTGYHVNDAFVAWQCFVCNAIGIAPLGPSNDEPEAVRVEMRAAELEVNPRVSFEEWPRGMVDLEPHGWLGHRREDSPIEPTATYFAGWLARELATHDNRETRDASAWPWDPTPPIAKQQPGSSACPKHPHRHPQEDEIRRSLMAPDAFDDESFDVSDVLPDSDQR